MLIARSRAFYRPTRYKQHSMQANKPTNADKPSRQGRVFCVLITAVVGRNICPTRYPLGPAAPLPTPPSPIRKEGLCWRTSPDRTRLRGDVGRENNITSWAKEQAPPRHASLPRPRSRSYLLPLLTMPMQLPTLSCSCRRVFQRQAKDASRAVPWIHLAGLLLCLFT